MNMKDKSVRYSQGYLATIKYKWEILRLKMGMYETINDYKIQYLW